MVYAPSWPLVHPERRNKVIILKTWSAVDGLHPIWIQTLIKVQTWTLLTGDGKKWAKIWSDLSPSLLNWVRTVGLKYAAWPIKIAARWNPIQSQKRALPVHRGSKNRKYLCTHDIQIVLLTWIWAGGGGDRAIRGNWFDLWRNSCDLAGEGFFFSFSWSCCCDIYIYWQSIMNFY